MLCAESMTTLQAPNITPPMCDPVVEIVEGQGGGGGFSLCCFKTTHHAKGLRTPSLTESSGAWRQNAQTSALVCGEHSAVMGKAEP